ncbi:hypothetical protein ARMGADRAFT_1092961 [Armillaria gallica]|uniref:Uncharacterized protein n=1 Tax=Armillaria gallica TaxID=47427 RepID=A0A2H3CU36_ARMGA|nr:hypothetical protein ARMGADRAFT_1092961 [Armillaria gallica]
MPETSLVSKTRAQKLVLTSTFTEPPSTIHNPAAAADVASDNGTNYDSENDRLDAVAYLELDSDYDLSVDDNEGWNKIASEEFQDALLAHAVQLQEEMQDAKDVDWILSPVRINHEWNEHRKTACLKETQQSLDALNWWATPGASGSEQWSSKNSSAESSDIEIIKPPPSQPDSSVPSSNPSQDPSWIPSPAPVIGHTCSASVLSDALLQADKDDDEYNPNTWDHILDDIVDSRAGVAPSEDSDTAQPAPTNMLEICNWPTLRK